MRFAQPHKKYKILINILRLEFMDKKQLKNMNKQSLQLIKFAKSKYQCLLCIVRMIQLFRLKVFLRNYFRKILI